MIICVSLRSQQQDVIAMIICVSLLFCSKH